MYTPESQQQYIDLSKKFLSLPADVKDLGLLRDVLIFHERKYYIEDNPLISDFEYDQLYKQLVALEEAHPDQITPCLLYTSSSQSFVCAVNLSVP